MTVSTEIGKILRKGKPSTNGKPKLAPPILPASEPWERPIPLKGLRAVPPFPVECLPAWLADWVSAEAVALQVPPELPAMVAMSVCGAGLAKMFQVRVRPDWIEPLNIFAVAALLPGERKSKVFRDALTPVKDCEKAEQQRMAPIIAELQSEHRTLENTLKHLEAQAAKEKKPEEREFLKAEAKKLAGELSRHHVPDPPEFFCDDVTPEKLANLLSKQGGRMLQAAPEGTCFEIAKGRYSETANFDVYLKGHAGDSLRTGRISREGENVDSAALGLAICVQPDVIRGLASEASMRGRGFLARFLYAMPTSLVGRRLCRPKPVPDAVFNRYRDMVTAIWTLTGTVDDSGKESPHTLVLSPEADEMMLAFEEWLEPQLALDGALHLLAGWGNKLAGAIARISGILHMAEAVTIGSWKPTIRDCTLQSAISIGRGFLLEHAIAAFEEMGADPRLEDAERVVRWLIDSFCESVKSVKGGGLPKTVSKRDIHAKVFGGSRTVDDVDDVIMVLLKHGYIRAAIAAREHGTPGRKPSERFEVNPYIDSQTGDTLSHNSQIHRTTSEVEGDGYADSYEPPADRINATELASKFDLTREDQTDG